MRQPSFLNFAEALLLSLTATAGCRRDPPPPPAINDAAAVVVAATVTEAGAATTVTKTEDDAANGTPPKTAAEIAKDAKPPIDGEMDQPIVRIKPDKEKGKLVVWSQPDGEMSLVLAGLESKPGELIGGSTAKVLRRTSGHVGALDAVSMTDGDLAIAWASSLGESKGGQLIALVFASSDLARVSAPTTLGIVAAPIALQGHVGLAKNPKGGVIVAHQGPTVKCTLLDQPTECVSFDVKAVTSTAGGALASAYKVERLGGSKLHGGPSPEYFFVDLDGRGLGVYASSMRGGRTIESIVVPYAVGDTAPSVELPVCGGLAGYTPEFRRGAKGEIIAICISPRPDKEKEPCAKPTRDDPNRCPSIAITGSDGKLITPKTKDANVLRVECTDGKQKITAPTGDVTLTASSTLLADFTKGRCGP